MSPKSIASVSEVRVGLVFQEFLTGRRSYRASWPLELERDVSLGRTAPEPPADVWVLPALWDLTRRCVAPAPADRFPTMAALEAALSRTQRELSLTLSPEAVRALTA